MIISKAVVSDANEITTLTLRSKAHWNYSRDQMEQWREELIITPDYIEKNSVFVMTLDTKIIGFYACKMDIDQIAQLSFLFIEPEFIGQGIGKSLLSHCVEMLRKQNCQILRVESDPNAEHFYKKLGFEIIGKIESSIKIATYH